MNAFTALATMQLESANVILVTLVRIAAFFVRRRKTVLLEEVVLAMALVYVRSHIMAIVSKTK